MASKKPAPTDEELLAELDSLGTEDKPQAQAQTSKAAKASKKANPMAQEGEDLLAELGSLAQERPKSRPHTPRVSGSIPRSSGDIVASGRTSEEGKEKASTSAPAMAAGTNAGRKSAESARAYQPSFAPSGEEANAAPLAGGGEQEWALPTQQQTQQQTQASGGSWWGGFVATATAAVTQAQAIAKDLQNNEEAQKWADQVKGNVGVLRNYGGELRSRALPTFTNILNTLAPPISSHERLQIHITHDFVGYPSLDPLIYQTFSRVMAQVEGGELMVIQRGQEAKQRPGGSETAGYKGASTAGWSDGPWWRSTEKRSFGAVGGLVEGTKLAKVSAEAHAGDYFAPLGGVEEATKRAAETLSESNPTRSSDIFMCIQAINYTAQADMFGGSGQQAAEAKSAGVADPDSKPEDLATFAIYLHDPIHSITFHTVTQSLPAKWVGWINQEPASADEPATGGVPDEISEIIGEGGVDPREWVAEWVEEVLALGVGMVAQRYVARRMGVGEGGLGRGKARQAAVEAGAGEAARAM